MSVSSIGAAAPQPQRHAPPAKSEDAHKEPAKAEHHEAKHASHPAKHPRHKVDVKA